MDINEMLKGVQCACGRHHTCDIQYVYIEKNAAARLTEICKDSQKVLLVCDENTYAVAGKQVEAALAGKEIRVVMFSGKVLLVPDEDAIAEVTEALPGVDMIVGIGSGVIQDLCKYVSFYNRVPYIVVATAPSMDGYASNGAAMITDGMKVTYAAGLPRAILADTDVLAKAPMDMIKAGYGDIIGKYSALNDWQLSRCINGEYFCQYIYNVTMAQVQRTIQLAKGLLNREEESIRALMEALVIVGIMMSFAGSSRPASGSEHHLSHFFEVTGIVNGTPYFSHGLDVAYSTVITAGIREEIAAKPFPKAIYRPDPAAHKKAMEAVYGSVAAGCIALQDKLGTYTRDLGPVYLAKEQEIREILAQCPTAREMEELLSLAEIDMQDFYALYGEEKVANAVRYAKDIKDRYSVLWLNYDLFAGE